MNIFVVIYVFLIGLCVGSFVNVLIWRTLNGMSPYKGRSVCDSCKRKLAWFENIPVLSFLLLRGRCRTCKKKIDWSYPVVELATGLLFLWWVTLGFAFFRLTQSPLAAVQPVFWLVIGIFLLIIFFADLLYGIIPDFAVLLIGGLTLVYRVSLWLAGQMQGQDLIYSFVSAIVAGLFFLTMFLATKGKGMGFGDVKFSVVMGLLLGFPKSLVGFFLSFVLGGLFAGSLLISGKKKFGQTVAFGPFLILGLVLALLYGEKLWFTYLGYLQSGML